MKELAPIALFVYNRPEHTRKCLQSLMKCRLADQSKLIIFSDGPKENATKEDIERIRQVRKVIRSERWCESVEFVEQENNKGLRDSIISGVTKIVNQYGRIIVLEDDLVLSPGFLDYMNNALDLYQDEERVMHISGFMFDVDKRLPETFFYNVTTTTGWATWKRAWGKLETNPTKLLQELKRNELLDKFNLDGAGDFALQLYDNISGNLRTWGILWYASVHLNNGLCLHPGKSLLNNIGFDSLASNTQKGDIFEIKNIADKIEVCPIPIEENFEARKAMIELYRSSRGSIKNFIYKHYTNSAFIRLIFKVYPKIMSLVGK